MSSEKAQLGEMAHGGAVAATYCSLSSLLARAAKPQSYKQFLVGIETAHDAALWQNLLH